MPLLSYSTSDTVPVAPPPGALPVAPPPDVSSSAPPPAQPQKGGLISYSTTDTTGPSVASQGSAYVSAGGGTTYGDWVGSTEAGLRGAGATAASGLSAIPEWAGGSPEQTRYWQEKAAEQRAKEQEDIASETPAGQQGREGSFLRHPVQQMLEGAPGFAVQAGSALGGAAVGSLAGPIGTIAGGMAGGAIGGGGWQGAESINEQTQAIMAAPLKTLMANPEFAGLMNSGTMDEQTARQEFAARHGADAAGEQAAIGAIASVPFGELGGGGSLVGKIVGDKLVMSVLGVGAENAVIGAGAGVAGEQVQKQAGADIGIDKPATAGELAEAGLSGAEFGAALGVGGNLLHRWIGGHDNDSTSKGADTDKTGQGAKATGDPGARQAPAPPTTGPLGEALKAKVAGAQTGGESTVKRTPTKADGSDSPNQDIVKPPADAKGAAPTVGPDASLPAGAIDPAAKAALSAAQAPADSQSQANSRAKVVDIQSKVAQPDVLAQKPQGAPPAPPEAVRPLTPQAAPEPPPRVTPAPPPTPEAGPLWSARQSPRRPRPCPLPSRCGQKPPLPLPRPQWSRLRLWRRSLQRRRRRSAPLKKHKINL